MSRERRLGRGLASLLGESNEPVNQDQAPPKPRLHDPDGLAGTTDRNAPDGSGIAYSENSRPIGSTSPSSDKQYQDGDQVTLSVYEIEDNPYQPRRDFSETEIVSLSESLKEHDMLQPVLVRRVGQRWQLISGERRLRAAIHAGWTSIPARIRQADDRLVAELAIVENLQRKDLNPIEKALSFRRYLDEHKCTQEDLGKRLKIDRSTIANLVRLLELPQQVQDYLGTGAITAGHARAILPLGDEQAQVDFADEIRRDGLSVRATERMVQERVQAEDENQAPTAKRPRKSRTQSPQVATLEQQLRIALGTRVDIKQATRKRGQIVVHFRSPEEFERIVEMMTDGDDASGLGTYAG